MIVVATGWVRLTRPVTCTDAGPAKTLSLARDHAVELDGRAGARVEKDDEQGPSPMSVVGAKWAIQDSNLGPLPYQRSALTI
jgi:hypothetical protein